jgi:hypothetical protein
MSLPEDGLAIIPINENSSYPAPALIPEFIDILKEIRQRLHECGAGSAVYDPVIDGKAQIYLKSLRDPAVFQNKIRLYGADASSPVSLFSSAFFASSFAAALIS